MRYIYERDQIISTDPRGLLYTLVRPLSRLLYDIEDLHHAWDDYMIAELAFGVAKA